jgi:XrtJ-associated TM-motif-TM protein
MKFSFWVLVALVLCVTAPVLAQTGCVNSPENPTAILALVGSAGGGTGRHTLAFPQVA